MIIWHPWISLPIPLRNYLYDALWKMHHAMLNTTGLSSSSNWRYISGSLDISQRFSKDMHRHLPLFHVNLNREYFGIESWGMTIFFHVILFISQPPPYCLADMKNAQIWSDLRPDLFDCINFCRRIISDKDVRISLVSERFFYSILH